MKPAAKARGGRPRGFDREAALAIAIRLFWRHGYEGVSTNDLSEAMGIAPPSLYAAFGNKGVLFEEALARYADAGDVLDLGGASSASTLEDAARRLLEGAVRTVTDPSRERGCMISSGMLACHPDHERLARAVADRRRAMQDSIAGLLRTWTNEGEASRLARYLATVLQGLSVQARDGVGAADLRDVADMAITGMRASGTEPRRHQPRGTPKNSRSRPTSSAGRSSGT